MVSKANDDLPLPLIPVTTTRALRGMERSIFFRLFSRAPRICNSLSSENSFKVLKLEVSSEKLGVAQSDVCFCYLLIILKAYSKDSFVDFVMADSILFNSEHLGIKSLNVLSST